MLKALSRTDVFDSYWQFAAERLAIYYRRLTDPIGPWTTNAILQEYRFTNTFRAADRVSQYLIREVQYRPDRSQAPAEVFFRTMLFKLFNRIETWETLESHLGAMSWQNARLDRISMILDRLIGAGERVYSAAYIMPSPAFGHLRKHANHLALLAKMMDDNLPGRLERAPCMRAAYELMRGYPGLGPFLAFQYTIDLNYSSLLNFSESEFVVAGPGAIDGIMKCFANAQAFDPSEIINDMVERQGDEFKRLSLDFKGLFGRPLHPIDCQNLFCEISKYARVAHPNIAGKSGRTRIKQRYKPADGEAPVPSFPPKWKLSADSFPQSRRLNVQLRLGLA